MGFFMTKIPSNATTCCSEQTQPSRGGSFFDTRLVHAHQYIARPRASDHAVGLDLGERNKYERAFKHVGMRAIATRFNDDNVVIGEEIDVDRARSPADFT